MDDIKTAAEIGVDFVAVSFPKSAADMYMARQLLRAAGSTAVMIAKIERVEAITNLAEILDASDGIMVARGDLAGRSRRCHGAGAAEDDPHGARQEQADHHRHADDGVDDPSPVPTRAEVSDVANAVLDGTDAVMLSAETASGKYPVEVVESMARICVEAERSAEVTLDREFLDRIFTRIDQSIAMAAIWTAHHLKVKAIAALTQSGSTALWMSRINCGVPIYALTPDADAVARMVLYREVYPLLMSQQHTDRDRCWPKPNSPDRRASSTRATSSCSPSASRSVAPAAPTPEDRPRRRAPNPLN
jgi:pyruvate kinase